MKRIMFICQSLGSGGAERVVSVLANKLTDKGYTIYILAMTKSNLSYKLSDKVKVLLPNRKRAGYFGKIERIQIIRKAVIANKIDVIIAFSHYNAMFSVLACLGLKVRLIGSERNDPAQLRGRKVINLARNILYRYLDVLVCQTDDAKAYFPEAIQKKTKIILNPVSDHLPEPYMGKKENRIVSFCRLEPQKNIPMLIDAFEMFVEEYPDYALDIYGDGNEKDLLNQYIKDKKLGNKVSLNPFESDIYSKVLKAKIFSLASDYEGLSNAMIEAMAMGLAVVVTDCPCGGARMVIDNMSNGMLVGTGKPEEMCAAWKYLITHEDICQAMSLRAIKIRDILDVTKISKQWENLLMK